VPLCRYPTQACDATMLPMTKHSQKLAQTQPELQILPWWFIPPEAPINVDFDLRVVLQADQADWFPTHIEGLQIRILEFDNRNTPLLTAEVRLLKECPTANLGENHPLEILIEQGFIATRDELFDEGHYLRIPIAVPDAQHLNLHAKNDSPARLYVSAGQMLQTDTEQRHISTDDSHNWLPGPTAGTEVFPLHGHGTGNVMLIRWNEATSFQPRLDPRGEEILVLRGTLHDELASYTQGCWIRTPERSWQAWGAEAETVVYYKNGHFLDSPD